MTYDLNSKIALITGPFQTFSSPSGHIESSKMIGKIMADYIKKEKIGKIAFDRSGYRYHGKIKALADSMRENGVKI